VAWLQLIGLLQAALGVQLHTSGMCVRACSCIGHAGMAAWPAVFDGLVG